MRNTNLFSVVAACAAGFLGGTLASHDAVRASTVEAVRASRFELVDSAGRAVARWEVDNRTNSAHLYFLGRSGATAIDTGVLSDAGPFLRMSGRDGKNRVALELDVADKPSLGMSDERWLGRIVLGHAATDTPDVPSSTDSWALQFRPFGTTLPAAMIGMTGPTKPGASETKGLLFVNGERIR